MMRELILATMNQNVDYIHFIIGLLTISLAFFLLVFSNQRKYWMSEDHLIFFIIYLGVMGLAVWIDLILRTFTDSPLFETVHSLFYLVAYLALYEFGRRMLFCQKKNMTLFLYLFPFASIPSC